MSEAQRAKVQTEAPAHSQKAQTRIGQNPQGQRDTTPTNKNPQDPKPNTKKGPQDPKPTRNKGPQNPKPNRNKGPQDPKPNRDKGLQDPIPTRNKGPQDPKPRPYRWGQGIWCQSSCCPGRHFGPVLDSHAAPGTGLPGWPRVCTASSTGHTECHPLTSRCTALLVRQSSVSPAQNSRHVLFKPE